MNKNHKINKKIFELDKKDVSYAIATVINIKGSSSSKTGDKALYNEQGKRIMGYIGGGCIENRIGISASEAINEKKNKIINLDLNSDKMEMGIPCGGYMSVLIEPTISVPTIMIRGMGRSAEVLCKMAKTLGFKVIIQTSKIEEEHFLKSDIIINENKKIPYDKYNLDYFVLVTHHRDDHKIALEAIKNSVQYVAVVASEKKSSLIKNYLIENKLSREQLSNFHSPAGIKLNAKSPEEIALSIMSEIIMHKNN